MLLLGRTKGTAAEGEYGPRALLTTPGGLIVCNASGVPVQLSPGSQGKVPAVQSDNTLAYERVGRTIFSDWQTGSPAPNNALTSVLTTTYSIPAAFAVGDLLIVDHVCAWTNTSGTNTFTWQTLPFTAELTVPGTYGTNSSNPRGFMFRLIVQIAALSNAAQPYRLSDVGLTNTATGGLMVTTAGPMFGVSTTTWNPATSNTFDLKIKSTGTSGQTVTNALTTLTHVPKGVLAA